MLVRNWSNNRHVHLERTNMSSTYLYQKIYMPTSDWISYRADNNFFAGKTLRFDYSEVGNIKKNS